MSKLQKALFLSDKGYSDLKKAIFACTLTNLAMLLPFCVTVMIFSEILTPLAGGGPIRWSRVWMLWGAGIAAAVLVFLAAKNDYRKTYIASYKESNATRLRIAEPPPPPPPAGRRLCGSCPPAWKRGPARRAPPPICPPVWPSSMSGLAWWSASAPRATAGAP